MKNKIIKSAVFLLILFILLIILSFIMIPKNNTKEAGMENINANGILGEKENTIDVLVVGDSEAYASIIPMKIWKEYGFTVYDCSSSEQTLVQSIQYVQEALKNQNPKIIILEANNIYRTESMENTLYEIAGKILPIIQYHNRWKSLTGNDLVNTPNYTYTDNLKGYQYKTEVFEADSSNYMTYTEDLNPIPRSNKIYVKMINEYCKKNNIKFIIMSMPSTRNWKYANHNAVKAFAKQEHIEFVDCNMEKDKINIDWKNDTRDGGDHLNFKGAKKVTAYIGNYLKNLNILEDHRQDEKYSSWNEGLNQYENLIKNKSECAVE